MPGCAPWLLGTFWSTALLSAFAEPAQAEDIGAFYEAYAIVTGTDMRQRPWGFANACERCWSRYRAIRD